MYEENDCVLLDHVHHIDYFDTVIPSKVQRGFSSLDIEFTRLSATEHYVAIGTNVGITYLYDRAKETIDKLRFEGSIDPVSCVACLETVDLMVAVGTTLGLVMIFQVPMDRSSDLEGKKPTVKRYLVTEMHRKSVTCLAWSRNGMKLFSGDEDGTVACTQMDYSVQQSRSSFVMCETDALVQLQYHQRMLLISTIRRTLLLCFTANDDDLGNLTMQIGVKERKVLGDFGACFHSFQPAQETTIFASRPALRLWKANTDGKVVETFIFKDDPLSPTCKIVGIGHDANANVTTPKVESQFGKVNCFGLRHLLIWNERQIYVICIDELRMVARCDDLGTIRSVTNYSDEIFVINGPRSIVRIASSPDPLCHDHNDGSSAILPTLWAVPKPFKELEIKWRDSHVTTSLLNKLKSTNLLPSSKSTSSDSLRVDVDPPALKVMPSDVVFTNEEQLCHEDEHEYIATENLSSSLVVGSDSRDEAADDQSKNWNVAYDEYIDEDDDDEEVGIVFERKSARRNKKRSSEEKLNVTSNDKPDLIASNNVSEEKPAISLNVDTIADKEKLLAKILGLDSLFSRNESKDVGHESTSPVLLAHNEPLDFGKITEDELAIGRSNNTEIAHPLPPPVPLRTCSLDCDDVYKQHGTSTEDDCSLTSNRDSYLSYGPPSGSSIIPSLNDSSRSLLSLPVVATNSGHVQSSLPSLPQLPYPHSLPTRLSPNLEPTEDETNSKFSDQWIQQICPKCIQSLAVCDEYIVCTDEKNYVYCSSLNGMGLDWHRMDYMAKQVVVSFSGRRVWRIYQNSAFALVDPSPKAPFGSKWIEVVLNVNYLSVDEHCVWFVTIDGHVMANNELETDRPCGKVVRVSCPWKVAQVSCSENVVWILTVDGKVACRVGVSSDHPLGFRWSLIDFGRNHIFAMALGTVSVGWIVDDTFTIWFKNGLSSKTSPKGVDKKWWRIKLCDYVFQSSSTLQTFTNALKESLHPEQLTSFLRASGNLCIVATKSRGVWFYNPNDGRLLSSNSHIVGHHWHKLDLSKKFRSRLTEMTASGVYHQHGGVWLWDRGPNIFYFNPTSLSVYSIRLPEPKRNNPLLCFCAAPEVLWILLESGSIYIRSGITLHHPLGNDWISLDLTQISDHKLVHVSCGPDVVWACDSQGNILMRIGALQAPAENCLPPAWVPVVDDRSVTQSTPFFVKVYVGPTSHIVWAIDGKRNVYVREGVFSDLLIGVGWVLVSGVQAVSLAISEQAVYALTNHGTIFRRFNITRNNFIGDYWRELPGYASVLSVSVNDHMWALDGDGRLLCHLSYVVVTSSSKNEASSKQKRVNSLEEQISVTEEEWEIVNAS